jgi:hypothetical protein
MEELIKVEAAPEAVKEKPSLSSNKKQIENRNLLSSFFVTLLIGLAFQEMIPPVRESIRSAGITFSTIALVSIFFLTSIRFFVGNQLHLMSEALTKLPGMVWLYDLIVIITQSILLVFLAGNTTVERNPAAGLGLVELLGALYLVDVLWIASQWVAGKVVPKWKRNFIPWGWAILNLSLVILMVILGLIVKDIYSVTGITWLLGLNFVAFLVDVLLMDYYDAI